MTISMCPEAARLCVVQINFRQWTGTSVLREEDFTVGTDGTLPPKEVIAQLGQKAIIDRKKLDVFAAIKARAVRYLQNHGVPFLQGWAIPLDKAEGILEKLDGFILEYEDARQRLIDKYDEWVESWIQQNPDFANQLRGSVKSRQEVARRISASYSAVRVVPVSATEVVKFNEEIRALGPALYRAVAQTASKIQVGSLDGSVTRPRPQIEKIREKLNGLSFLDAGITPLVSMIDGLLQKLPNGGKLDPQLFFELQAVVSILSDVDRMKAISDGRLKLDAWTQNFASLAPAATNPSEPSLFSDPAASAVEEVAKVEEVPEVPEVPQVSSLAEPQEAIAPCEPPVQSETNGSDLTVAPASVSNTEARTGLDAFFEAYEAERKHDVEPEQLDKAETPFEDENEFFAEPVPPQAIEIPEISESLFF